jgi:hypothetical protein
MYGFLTVAQHSRLYAIKLFLLTVKQIDDTCLARNSSAYVKFVCNLTFTFLYGQCWSHIVVLLEFGYLSKRTFSNQHKLKYIILKCFIICISTFLLDF